MLHVFNGGKLAGNEPMDRRFMFMKTILTPGGLSAKFYCFFIPDLR